MTQRVDAGDWGAQVVQVRAEHLKDALGIGVAAPRLSWISAAGTPGWTQAAYEIKALSADGSPRGETGRVESAESVLVAWPFAPLASREQVAVQVRVWGADGEASPWSEPAWVEAGLLDAADWSAEFITPAWDEDTGVPQPCPLFRREFTVRPGVARARLYATALGLYEMQLNGAVVGDQIMAPGWTVYSKRLRYQTYDVTAMLREGANALGAIVGEGWYRGRLGYGGGQRNIYGEHAGLLAQLEITYADGSRERVISDGSWRAATGPLLSSQIYDGEVYDARLERPGWSAPGYDDGDWAGVRPLAQSKAVLVAPAGPPIRRTQMVAPVEIITSPSGKTILDFGQNVVGRLRLIVRGPAGQTITLRHAEVLEHGELGTRPLRYAKATDQYTLRGAPIEFWEPRFTYHGFRYAEVTGWPTEAGGPGLDSIRAVVCHSDMERTGWFECSDPLINRMHDNVLWSMNGNFFDIPTDCPQRDERLGWTGDIQVFSPTASFIYDVSGFLASWLADVAAEQERSGGVVPFFVPNSAYPGAVPAAAWGDAAVIVPWVLYQRFGDTGILEAQFESMCAWVDVVAERAGASRLWDKGMQFGDWLDPAAPPESPGAARTPSYVVATACLARSAELVSQIAGLLGHTEAGARYGALAAEVRTAFAAEYVTPAGRVLGDSATAYCMALQWALLPDEGQRRRAGERLLELVRADAYHIATGFVGTPLVCDALCDLGYEEAAYRLLTQRECPSWLYPVTMGATTIWERWDSMLPDGSVNPGEMTSFNHYALGAVADWLHRHLAGLAPAEPGYRRLEIRPRPGAGLTYARAQHRTPYGTALCAWRIADGAITVEAEIPANTMARVTLPGREDAPLEVGSGRYCWTYAYRPPAKARAPLTLDSTLGQVLDDAEAYAAIMAILAGHNAEFADRTRGQLDVTLRQVIAQNPRPEELTAKIEAAIKA